MTLTEVFSPTAILRDRFDHNLWATLIWIDLLPRFRDSAAQEKLQRLFEKQETALKMCYPRYEKKAHANLKERAQQNCRDWRAFIEQADLSQKIEYTDPCGAEKSLQTVFDIAINECLSGSYCRGGLSQLARGEGWELASIPNTGPLLYAQQVKSGR